jgi:hypothetical protein
MSRRLACRLAFSIQLALSVFALSHCSDNSSEVAAPTHVTPVTEIDTVIAGNGDGWIGPYYPRLRGGNCEFGGRGPVVTLEAELYIEGANQLMCFIYMRAQETERDWSAAEDSWDEFLYQAPSGWRIVDMGLHPASCYVQYIDSDREEDINICDGFEFRSIGDVDGDDIICGRPPAENMTHVHVRLDTLFVKRQRI